MMKAALIGRHQLLPSQITAIEKAGIKIVKQIPQIPNETQQLQEFVKQLKSEGIEAIVVQALPIHLLAQLLQQKIRVFVLKMQAIVTTESKNEAERVKAEAPEKRVIIQSALGEKQIFRVSEFVGLYEVKEVKIVEELVATP